LFQFKTSSHEEKTSPANDNENMKTTLLACMALVMTSAAVFGAEFAQPVTVDLARDFKNPPESTKPRCY
jgi:hypothetical protein